MYDDFAYTRSTERVQRFWPQLVTYWNAQLKVWRHRVYNKKTNSLTLMVCLPGRCLQSDAAL